MNILNTSGDIYILNLIRRISERKEVEIKIQKIIKINKEKIDNDIFEFIMTKKYNKKKFYHH